MNGELLPFGEVECDRVRQSLQRTLGRGNPAKHDTRRGIALARVMAHELYHMKAHASTHTKDGVTKAALSSEDLAGGKLLLPRQARNSFVSISKTADEKAFSSPFRDRIPSLPPYMELAYIWS